MFLLSRHAVLIAEAPVGYRKVAALPLEASDMATGCPGPALTEAPGVQRVPRVPALGNKKRGPRVPSHNGVLGSPPCRKQETGYSGPLPERGPRVPSQQGLSHGYPTQGVTRESPTAICPGPTPTQNVETSISGSCWCGGHEAQRTSRQRPPTIVAGAERRQSLRRLHVAHPVLDHGVDGFAVACLVGIRRVVGAPTSALEAR
jgi:hypothetical protein